MLSYLAAFSFGFSGAYQQAPPPPYFLTGYRTASYSQPAAISIPGNVRMPETRMFRIDKDD